ncbi:MAG: DNA polymerase III subunit beta [Candidatus Taylorbacteria bacterium]|nr:DNA polymerase III subunit beta [Candidatus Taylorbacteria bacterium]
MKIETPREKLLNIVSQAQKITRRNPVLPILNCLLLEAVGNTLKIRATNLDLGIEVSAPVRVSSEGVVAVPGVVLYNLISGVADKNITLEVIDRNLSVETPHNKTLIKAVDPSDFPTLPKTDAEKSFKINAKDLVSGLRAVWYSSGTSHVKPELSSVYIYAEEGDAVFTATDSFRLAEKRVRLKKPKENFSILIPQKNIPEIKRVLEDFDGEIDVFFDKNQAAFVFDGVYLISRLIDGVFPDYKQIIPKEFKTEALALKEDLLGALKTATVFSDSFNQLQMEIKPSEKLFRVNTRNADVGENSMRVDATLKGQDLEINFNHRYILDCFQSLNADSVSLFLSGLSKPMVMQGVGDKSFTYLVMPMNK